MKLSDLKPGDVIVADGGFTCIDDGRECLVKADEYSDLYVDCCGADGNESVYASRHTLEGHGDDHGEVIGFAWPENRVAA